MHSILFPSDSDLKFRSQCSMTTNTSKTILIDISLDSLFVNTKMSNLCEQILDLFLYLDHVSLQMSIVCVCMCFN